MKKTDARVRYTKRALKEAFLSILQEKPVNRITVKEVCELAELNRATFYTHYSDCYALLESIEQELLDAFAESLRRADFMSTETLIEAIYDMAEAHESACRTLIFNGAGRSVLNRMTDLARNRTIEGWRKRLPRATETELEMLYIHLSNGLMHVVVDGYDRFEREEVIRFVSRIVQRSLTEESAE